MGIARPAAVRSGTAEASFATRLLQAVEDAFPGDERRRCRALLIFQHARELVAKHDGDPRIPLAAAALAAWASGETPPADGPPADAQPARAVLQRVGLGPEAIEEVWQIVEALGNGQDIDSPAYAIVRDAASLARMVAERHGVDRGDQERFVQEHLKTESARERARGLLGP